MKEPRAAAMPARNAAPYPRSGTRTTRTPRSSGIWMEPSVEPLSATITSPVSPDARNAFTALSTQKASEFASFRQGMTTDTSTGCIVPARSDCDDSEARVVPIGVIIISRPAGHFTQGAAATSSPDDSNPIRRLELANNLWESSVAFFPLANDADPAN